MKSILFNSIFLFLFIIISIPAQTFNSGVRGRIVQKSSGDPIIGANVYISGTLWGTTSDLNGYYRISSLPNGKAELIVSMIGFEPVVETIILKNQKILELDVELKQKVYEYGEVQVLAERPRDWENDLKLFKRLFLGTSEFSNYCEIENEVMLDFLKTDENELLASSREPLVILNNALGFRITCIIQNFSYDIKNERCTYKIATNFNELESTSGDKTGYWNQNRQKAFLGSIHHFLKTLKVDSLFVRGYKVQLSGDPRKSEIEVGNPIPSSRYLLVRDFLPNEHLLNFPDYLRVTYKDTFTKMEKISYLYLPYGNVTIDAQGYLYDDTGLRAHGFWSTLGIADMLPKYYFDLN